MPSTRSQSRSPPAIPPPSQRHSPRLHSPGRTAQSARAPAEAGLSSDRQCAICHVSMPSRRLTSHLRWTHAGYSFTEEELEAMRRITCVTCHVPVAHRGVKMHMRMHDRRLGVEGELDLEGAPREDLAKVPELKETRPSSPDQLLPTSNTRISTSIASSEAFPPPPEAIQA